MTYISGSLDVHAMVKMAQQLSSNVFLIHKTFQFWAEMLQFVCFLTKVIHPKHYKHLKKGAHHLGRQKIIKNGLVS